MNQLNYLEQNVIAAKLVLQNISLKDENGEDINVRDCYINVSEIKGLGEYIQDKDDSAESRMDLSKLSDRYVVPIYLPNGSKVEIEVQNMLQELKPEMAIYENDDVDLSDKVLIFDEILDSIPDEIKLATSPKDLENTFIPKNLEELAEKISKDELIINDKKQAIEMINRSQGERDEAELAEEKELNEENVIIEDEKNDSEEIKEDDKDLDEEAEEVDESKEKTDKSDDEKIAEETSEDVSRILSADEQLRNSGARLKQVVKINDSESFYNMVNSKDSGSSVPIEEGEVKLYRFADGGLNDRVVIVQGERVFSKHDYHNDLSEYMHKVESQEVDRLKDDTKVQYYDDKTGQMSSFDLVRKPNDLSIKEKEELKKELEKIDSQIAIIKGNSSKNDSPEIVEKNRNMIRKLNVQRKDLCEKYGLTLPEDAEVEKNIDEKEPDEKEPDEKEPEDDGRDPRESGFLKAEKYRI